MFPSLCFIQLTEEEKGAEAQKLRMGLRSFLREHGREVADGILAWKTPLGRGTPMIEPLLVERQHEKTTESFLCQAQETDLFAQDSARKTIPDMGRQADRNQWFGSDGKNATTGAKRADDAGRKNFRRSPAIARATGMQGWN